MACTNVVDVILREQGRTGGDLFDRIFPRSPWIRLVKRGVFPDGLGHTISVITYERTAPGVAQPTWAAVSGSETGTGLTATYDLAEGGNCLPTPDTIAVGSTVRTYSLCRRVLHGPDFCVENIRFSFQLRDQLEKVMNVLADYTLLEWEIRDRHEYLRLVKWKVSCAAGLPKTTNTSSECMAVPTSYWSTCPTTILSQGILNTWRLRLIRDGAGGSALGMQDGAPILTAILSGEASENLIFKEQAVREDLRWGNPPELLRAIGVNRSYRGFYHVIDQYPIRGGCAAGTFTEAAPFVVAAASKGNKYDVNPIWEGAYYEVNFIFDPLVFHQLIPAPITSPHPDFQFNPVNYLGDWRVRNIIDRDCNPDGTILFHRGILAAGSKPVHPERGVAFLSLRCDPTLNLTITCS